MRIVITKPAVINLAQSAQTLERSADKTSIIPAKICLFTTSESLEV